MYLKDSESACQSSCWALALGTLGRMTTFQTWGSVWQACVGKAAYLMPSCWQCFRVSPGSTSCKCSMLHLIQDCCWNLVLQIVLQTPRECNQWAGKSGKTPILCIYIHAFIYLFVYLCIHVSVLNCLFTYLFTFQPCSCIILIDACFCSSISVSFSFFSALSSTNAADIHWLDYLRVKDLTVKAVMWDGGSITFQVWPLPHLRCNRIWKLQQFQGVSASFIFQDEDCSHIRKWFFWLHGRRRLILPLHLHSCQEPWLNLSHMQRKIRKWYLSTGSSHWFAQKFHRPVPDELPT